MNLLPLVIILLLVISICIFVGLNQEGFVNTQSCLTVTSDQALEAYKLCSNMIGSDPIKCSNIIIAAACPIEGVAKDALILKFKEDTDKMNGTEPKIFNP
jgi:hypothetical protein